MDSFQQIESLINVTCSITTMRAFAELGDYMRATAAKITGGDIEAYVKTPEERRKKLAQVHVHIRKELGLNLDLTASEIAALAKKAASHE